MIKHLKNLIGFIILPIWFVFWITALAFTWASNSLVESVVEFLK